MKKKPKKLTQRIKDKFRVVLSHKDKKLFIRTGNKKTKQVKGKTKKDKEEIKRTVKTMEKENIKSIEYSGTVDLETKVTKTNSKKCDRKSKIRSKGKGRGKGTGKGKGPIGRHKK